jgi:hypothetical protein
MSILNLSARKVGGLTFIKLGRLTLSFSVSRRFKPLKGAKAQPSPSRLASRLINGQRCLTWGQA